MNTSTFGSGTLPAGSYTVPDSVVTTPPVQAGCVQLPFLHVDCWHCRPTHGPWPVLPPKPPMGGGFVPPFPPLPSSPLGENEHPPIANAANTVTRTLFMLLQPLVWRLCATRVRVR